MRYSRQLLIAMLVCPLIGLSGSAGEGIFTKAQAARGRTVYGEECAKCHGEVLTGGDGAPELTGTDFLERWNGKTVGNLFLFMKKTMPTDDPGHLSNRQYAEIAAFILSSNGFPAGARELADDESALNEIKIEAKQ